MAGRTSRITAPPTWTHPSDVIYCASLVDLSSISLILRIHRRIPHPQHSQYQGNSDQRCDEAICVETNAARSAQ
jgi:hypothetical protein